MSSIRRTLLVTLLGAVAVVTVAAASLVYGLVRREIDGILDGHLRQIALALRTQAPGGALAGVADEGLDSAIQIWDRDGERLYLSRPGVDLPEVAELGFATVRTRTGAWRVYSDADELSGLVVQVAQPLAARQRLAFAAAARTLVPVLLMLPLLAALVWSGVGRALAPLERLASDVAARTPSSLAPLPEAATPAEALPIVRSLNALLERLRVALAAQRALVADAAHELRTPLAALALQAQLAERARDADERAAALADLRAGLDRAAHVVQQLLALARAEPDAAPALPGEAVRLPDLVAEVVADQVRLAESRGVDLGAGELADGAVASGDPAALRTLLANLVENAVRHGSAGRRVDVSAPVVAGRPCLVVEDHGPGIPPAERGRVFDRFYRRAAGSEPGTGLGLAIVKAIADRHGAAVALGETPGGGLTVRVEFPARASAAPHAAAAPHRGVPPLSGP